MNRLHNYINLVKNVESNFIGGVVGVSPAQISNILAETDPKKNAAAYITVLNELKKDKRLGTVLGSNTDLDRELLGAFQNAIGPKDDKVAKINEFITALTPPLAKPAAAAKKTYASVAASPASPAIRIISYNRIN